MKNKYLIYGAVGLVAFLIYRKCSMTSRQIKETNESKAELQTDKDGKLYIGLGDDLILY